MDDPYELLSDWLAAVVATPGLTAIRDPERAEEMLGDEALRALLA